MRPIATALVLLAIVIAAAGAADERDSILDKKGKKYAVTIITEYPDKLAYKFSDASPKETTLKWSEVAKWEYVEMRTGSWPSGVDARDRGNYEEAADRFEQVAQGGREWQKVYGAFYEGDALELAGKYSAAAESFARLEQYSKHRLWLDGRYRQGFCLALAKKEPEATKIADELTAYAKTNTIAQAETRANAIRAAIAGAKMDAVNLSKFQAAARFSALAEPDEWFHFAVFYANALRLAGKDKDALGEFRTLTSQLDNDPAKKAQASFGYGQCLATVDKQAALVELLKLDALPYGSPAEKCEARFLAGKLLWEEAKAGQAEAESGHDDKRLAFHKANAKTARALLNAAVGSTADTPGKAGAKSFLESIGPDPEEKAAADKAAKEAKEKGAADKAAAKGDAEDEK
jgi:hypothetical protein